MSSLSGLYKFGEGTSPDRPWVNRNVWTIETTSIQERLTIAPRANSLELLKNLLHVMPGPMWLLYVLIVPRGEGEPGRYQTPKALPLAQVDQFLNSFGGFLETDGRQNLWIRSASGAAMLVYDRHNLIYAYGPLSSFGEVLLRGGLAEAEPDSITVPDPHSHYYHPRFDGQAADLLAAFDWHRTPLREEDLR